MKKTNKHILLYEDLVHEGAGKEAIAKFKKTKAEANKRLKGFVKNLSQESKETQMAFKKVKASLVSHKGLSDKDKEFIQEQLGDVLKTIGLTAATFLPGGILYMALTQHKKTKKFTLPSSFRESSNEIIKSENMKHGLTLEAYTLVNGLTIQHSSEWEDYLEMNAQINDMTKDEWLTYYGSPTVGILEQALELLEKKVTKKQLDKALNSLAKVTTEMKEIVKLWRDAKDQGNSEDEKKYLEELRTKTTEKQDAEKIVQQGIEALDANVGLEIVKESVNEARSKLIDKKIWDKMSDDEREEALLTVFSDPDDAIEWIESDYNDLPPQASHMEVLEAESVTEAVPSVEDYHTKDKKDVLFTIEGPHKKALATSRDIYKDAEKYGMIFDEFFDNDKGNESGKHLISFPAAVNDVSSSGIKQIIKLVGKRGTHIERPNWVSESIDEGKAIEVTQEMWDKDWKLTKTYGKEFDEHYAKRIEAAMSKAKSEDQAEGWAFKNWKQLPNPSKGMTIEESVNEEAINKSDLSYQLHIDYTGNTKPKITKLNKSKLQVMYGYKINPQDVIDSFNKLYPDTELTHVEWSDKMTGGGFHIFKIEKH